MKKEDNNNKQACFSSKSDDWETPLWLYKEIAQSVGIEEYDTDPCTYAYNPLGCKHFYTKEQDGLKQKWYGNVFINPPFGFRKYEGKRVYMTGLWIEESHYRSHTDPDIKLITLLIPSRTDTEAFHKYVYDMENQKFRDHVTVKFLKGRKKFGGSKLPAPFPSIVIHFWNPYS